MTKGILFKGEMIRALLNTKIGSYPAEPIDVSKPHKGQTRRLIDPQPDFIPELETYSPSFPPGTILYAKETFSADGAFGVDGRKVYRADIAGGKHPSGLKWKPSIFMPKVAARLWFEVAKVRVERVNQISEADALAEGIEIPSAPAKLALSKPNATAYRRLWDSINGEGSFNKGEWVWVYDIMRINKPEGV
jgi:hypothetical protein